MSSQNRKRIEPPFRNFWIRHWKGRDHFQTADEELATALSRTVQVPPIISEASHVAKTFISLAALLSKMEKLQPSTR